MHLRSGTHHTRIHQRYENESPLYKMAPTAVVPQNANRGAVTKKLVLWLVLLLQICIIGCFWLLQLGFSASISDAGGGGAGAATDRREVATDSSTASGDRVNFIKKVALGIQAPKQNNLVEQQDGAHNVKDSRSNFEKDFCLLTNRLNKTGIELEQRGGVNGDIQLWCFREGTVDESSTPIRREAEEDDTLLWEYEQQCKCKPNWHGKDCGQPEVIWRTLMTARKPFKMLNPSKDLAHRLVYMLEGNFFDLDLMELQINEVIEVVDYFIIYYKYSGAKLKDLRALERRLKDILDRDKYIVHHCGHSKAKRKQNCTAAQAYYQLKTGWQIRPTDLFIYTSDQELISPSALRFLKYYAADVHLMRFRLKYIVYGFHWQHPQQTHLTGLLSSFLHLDDPQLGNGSPTRLLQNAHSADSAALVIGDLNHFGGWFCKYCQQPTEIISELSAESSSLHHVQFPNDTKTHHIDAGYLQKLMANGIYVDGKTQLTKLRRYADKYYAPMYAEKNSWKFGHLLANLFESLGEDTYDEGAY